MAALTRLPRHRVIIPLTLLTVITISVYYHFSVHVPSHAPLHFGLLPNLFSDGAYRPQTSRLSEKVVYNIYYMSDLSPNKSIWMWTPKNVRNLTQQFKMVRLSVSPWKLNNGDVVVVEWNNPTARIQLDVLALYCPSDAPYDSLIDYWPLSKITDYSQHGKGGRVKMALFNTRRNCEFRMFSNGTGGTQLVATSREIDFIDATEVPLHGHLALTGDPHEMRVQWTTGVQYVPTVQYGHSPSDLRYAATGSFTTYSAQDMCGPPANLSAHFLDPGNLHNVLLTELEPNTRYFYRYGNDGYRFSQVKSFISSPEHGSEKTLRFIVYGDMDITSFPGSETTAKRAFQEASSNYISFVLHIGDLSYALGLAYRWEEWMTMIEPIATSVPYMVSIGNHDQNTLVGGAKDPSGYAPFHPSWGSYKHDSGGECGVPMVHRFHMPNNGNLLYWYSFVYGSVHLIQLSSEHDFRPGSPQYLWLSRTLKKVDRRVTPWVIVTSHRPLYSSSGIKSDYVVSLAMREALESILVQHQVDLFVGGHLHSYERTCRVYKSQCSSRKGMIHVVVGTAGSEVDSKWNWKLEWSVRIIVASGYGRVSVNRTDLLWEFVRNEDGIAIDSVVFQKLQ